MKKLPNWNKDEYQMAPEISDYMKENGLYPHTIITNSSELIKDKNYSLFIWTEGCWYGDLNYKGEVNAHLKRFLSGEELSKKEINEITTQYQEESMSGDYDNLLRTAMKWVNVL